MPVDPFSADIDLEHLREHGRARIDAASARERIEKEKEQRGLPDDQRKFAELRTWSTWRSISLWGHVWFFGIFLLLGVPCVIGAPALLFGAIPREQIIGYLVLVALVLGTARFRVERARQRTFAFVRGQPFPLLGYEASMQHYAGPGRGGPQHVRVKLVFADRAPDIHVLRETVCAARTLSGPEPLVIRADDEGYELRLAGGSIFQGHRYWFARYMPGLCEVLSVVHRTYPIAFVRVVALP